MRVMIALVTLAVPPLAGCAAYNRTGWWTPDSFNYTYATDGHATPTHYIGLGWTIKDKP